MTIDAGLWETRGGSYAQVGFRHLRGDGSAYWEGTLQSGGPCEWSEDGKDLRGYDEFDLVRRCETLPPPVERPSGWMSTPVSYPAYLPAPAPSNLTVQGSSKGQEREAKGEVE